MAKKKYADGGQPGPKKPKPIVVSSPNDPKLRAYNDSLKLYNFTKDDINKIREIRKAHPAGGTEAQTAWADYADMRAKSKSYIGVEKAYYNLNKLNKKYPAGDMDFLYNSQGKPDATNSATAYKKPVQPVVYQKPQQTPYSKAEQKLRKSGQDNPHTWEDKDGKVWQTQDPQGYNYKPRPQFDATIPPPGYNKKYPPIYVTNPKDPRIWRYAPEGNQYLYKVPPERKDYPLADLNRLKAHGKATITPGVAMADPEPQGQYLYGPSNSVIGIYDDKGNVTPYNRPDQRGKVNKADLEMLDNPESMKKYVQTKGLKMKKGGNIAPHKHSLGDTEVKGEKMTKKQKAFFQDICDGATMKKKAWGGPIPVNPFPNGFKVPGNGIQSIPADPNNPLWSNAPALGDPNVSAPVDIYRDQRIPNANYQPNNAPPGGFLNNNMTPVTNNKPAAAMKSPEEAIATPPNMTPQNKPKKQKSFGNALGGKTGADSIPGQIAGATLQVLDNIIQEKDRPKNMYLRPEDLPTYNPHPYGVLNSQGQGSQAISKNGKNIKGKKAFWGALIGAVAGGGGAAAAGGAGAAGAAAGTTAAVGTAGAVAAIPSAIDTSAGAARAASTATNPALTGGGTAVQQAAPAAKGIKGAFEKPIRQTTEAIQATLQDTIDFTKMISQMRETNVDPANVQQANYAKLNQVEAQNLQRMYQPSMAKGGNVKGNGSGLVTYEGGSAPKESSNMFDGGTHMFQGDSHSEGGIKSSYMGTPFEAEGGEPFSVIGDKGVVFGKLINPLTGRQYKKDAKEIMKKEQKTEDFLVKGIKLVHEKDPYNKFERLAFNAGYATMIGAATKQKQLAASKEHLSDMQKAHLQLLGEEPEVAEKGKEINPLDPYPGDRKNKSNKSKYSKAEWEDYARKIGYTGDMKKNDEFQRYVWNHEKYGPIAQRVHGVLGSAPDAKGMPKTGRYDDGLLGHRWDQIIDEINFPQAKPSLPQVNLSTKPGNTLTPFTPYKRPALDPGPEKDNPYPFQNPEEYPMSKLKNKMNPLQFTGEIAGLLDRPEPVKAQLYTPELYTPYQVSFQDRINEQNSTFNAIQKSLAYDPTSLATLAAQKYTANDSVKAEEFRVNQGIANDVINKNNSLLNDAKLKNLNIIDNQYVRQSTAKSITKQNKFNALSSISSKVLQNKAETNLLNTYRNLFPHYGFDKDFKAVKEGAPGSEYLSFNGPIAAPEPSGRTVTSYDPNGKKKGSRITTLSDSERELEELRITEQKRKLGLLPKLFQGKNGAIIKKYKE